MLFSSNSPIFPILFFNSHNIPNCWSKYKAFIVWTLVIKVRFWIAIFVILMLFCRDHRAKNASECLAGKTSVNNLWCRCCQRIPLTNQNYVYLFCCISSFSCGICVGTMSISIIYHANTEKSTFKVPLRLGHFWEW